jgi:transcriptional regulator with XRE-family HTH domain
VPRTSTSEVLSKAVGEEIAHARHVAGLTQVGLGQRMGTSGAYVAKVETGRANLTLGQLAVFANALGTGLEIHFPAIERETVKLRDPALLAQPRRA